MIITPIQKGMNQVGAFLSGFSDNMTDAASLREENALLQTQVDNLKAENSKLVLNKEELNRLQNLLELKEQYTDYDTVGAHVISKGSGNWFTTFTIDKGTEPEHSSCAMIIDEVYGGGNLGIVGGNTTVNVIGARIGNSLFAGGNGYTAVVYGNRFYVYSGSPQVIYHCESFNFFKSFCQKYIYHVLPPEKNLFRFRYHA